MPCEWDLFGVVLCPKGCLRAEKVSSKDVQGRWGGFFGGCFVCL